MKHADATLLRTAIAWALMAAGCGGGSGSVETQTATLGIEGGTISSADGTITLSFPEGALTQSTSVTLQITEAKNGKGELQLVSRIVDISLNPPLQGVLAKPARLGFGAVTQSGQTLRIARQLAHMGEVIETEGNLGGELAFWLPLKQTGIDDDGHPFVELTQFSPYCTVRGQMPQTDPPNDMLEPPPTPAGMRYVGAEVANNFVYDEGRSTAPLDRRHKTTDQLFVRSQTVGGQGSTKSDIVVVHIFEPDDSDNDCPIPLDELVPPPPPEGMRYVGRAVVVNFVWNENLSDDRMLGRPTKETDVTFIRSMTRVVDNVLICDYIVSFTYEPIPMSTTDVGVGGGTASSTDEKLRVEFPNQSLDEDTDVLIHSTSLPLGFVTPSVLDAYQVFILPPPPLELMPVAFLDGFPSDWVILTPFELQTPNLTVASGSTDSLDNALRPLPYARLDENEVIAAYLPNPIEPIVVAPAVAAPCEPSAGALAQPAPPEVGCTYVGRHVVVDFVYQDAPLSTVPLNRVDRPDDKVVIQAETTVQNGVICDWIVAHVFEAPGSVEPCPIPEGFLDVPPAPGPNYCYKGRDVVINNVLTETTVTPLNRPLKASDLHVLRSDTTISDDFQCDVIVRHLFELSPGGCG